MAREIFWPWMVSCWCTLIHIVHVIFQGQVWLPKGCTGWWFQSREQLLFKHWKHHSWYHYHLDGNKITIKHVPSNPDVAPHLKRIIINIIIIIKGPKWTWVDLSGYAYFLWSMVDVGISPESWISRMPIKKRRSLERFWNLGDPWSMAWSKWVPQAPTQKKQLNQLNPSQRKYKVYPKINYIYMSIYVYIICI